MGSSKSLMDSSTVFMDLTINSAWKSSEFVGARKRSSRHRSSFLLPALISIRGTTTFQWLQKTTIDYKAFPQRWALLEGGTAPSNLSWIVWTKRSKRYPSRLMIEVWPMVHTVVDMIVNHINHHYINHHHIDHQHIDHYDITHHQGIIYNILNLLKFFMKKNCEVPSITIIMIMKIEGYSMIGKEGSLILTLVGEADFQT